MPKEFYTERDIEDMFKRGEISLRLTDDVVLTELAYEKANRLGMQLLRGQPDNPPSAPIRPYLSQITKTSPPVSLTPKVHEARDDRDLYKRIHDAVNARLGTQIDPDLLDRIIRRVLQSTGVK